MFVEFVMCLKGLEEMTVKKMFQLVVVLIVVVNFRLERGELNVLKGMEDEQGVLVGVLSEDLFGKERLKD